MNTRKQLDIVYGFEMILAVLGAVGTVICLFAWISGETPLPFIICVIVAITSYLGAVFTGVVIDFYDAIVTKHKMETAIFCIRGSSNTTSGMIQNIAVLFYMASRYHSFLSSD